MYLLEKDKVEKSLSNAEEIFNSMLIKREDN